KAAAVLPTRMFDCSVPSTISRNQTRFCRSRHGFSLALQQCRTFTDFPADAAGHGAGAILFATLSALVADRMAVSCVVWCNCSNFVLLPRNSHAQTGLFRSLWCHSNALWI